MTKGDPLVVMSGINKWYGDMHALKDIDLTVHEGEVVVVIGPSGSGKSTLIRTINRLEPIQEGEIRIDGELLPEEERGWPSFEPRSAWSSSRSTSSPTRPSSRT
ncbi:MAG: ATP-binding cassette domain-containing protein [Acidimicrobiales bacterium]